MTLSRDAPMLTAELARPVACGFEDEGSVGGIMAPALMVDRVGRSTVSMTCTTPPSISTSAVVTVPGVLLSGPESLTPSALAVPVTATSL